jgi:DNA polymerase
MGGALTLEKPPGGRLALAELYNSPIEAVSWAMRGLLCAAPGNRLIAADFSNIEGRAIAWLAGESWKLGAFRDYDLGTGADLYKITAGKILNIDPSKVSKTQRQAVGKPAELGLGFGGGVGAILTMMRNGAVTPWMRVDGSPPAKITLDDIAATVRAGVPAQVWADTSSRYAEGAAETAAEILEDQRLQAQWLELADDDQAPSPWADNDELRDLATEIAKSNRLNLSLEHWTALKCIVDLWRQSNSKIAQFWKDLEAAAKSALKNPGQVFSAGRHIKFCKRGIFLVMQLPSGRCIHYPYAKLATRANNWGGESEQIIYMRRVNGRSGRWFFKALYGGEISNNCTQAVARDVLRDALLRLDGRGYQIVLHVHDEIIAEMPKGVGSLEEFKSIMATLEPWAMGLPVAVDGYEGKRFKK